MNLKTIGLAFTAGLAGVAVILAFVAGLIAITGHATKTDQSLSCEAYK